MATVPRVTGPSVEVRPTPFVAQSAEGATPDAFGAAAGRGMVQAGQQLAAFGEQVFRTAERIRLEEDDRAAKEAETEFARQRIAIVRGDGTDQNPGYYGLAGQNAVDGYKGAREALDAARDEIAKNMQSERARTRFLQRANAQIVDEDNTMLGFVTQNRRVAADATSKVRIETLQGEAARFYNDQERVGGIVGQIEEQVRADARRNGIVDQGTVDGLVQSARTSTIKAAFGSALDAQDTETAQRMLQQYAGQLDGRVQADLARILRDKIVDEEAQNLAETYFAQVNLNDPASIKRVIDRMYADLKGPQQDKTLAYFNERLRLVFGIEDQGMQRDAAARARQNDIEARQRREAADARRVERDAIADEERRKRDERREAADKRREEKDAIAAEERRLAQERREAADARRQRRDEEETRRIEQRIEREARQLEDRKARLARQEEEDRRRQATEDRQLEDRRMRIARQEAADARRGTQEEQQAAAVGLAETVMRQGGTQEQQLAKLREAATGEVLMKAEEYLSGFNRRAQAAREQTSRETYARVSDLVEAGTDPRRLPQADRDALTPEMFTRLEARFRVVSSGAPTASVPGAFEAYSSLPTDRLALVDLSVARQELSDEHYNRLVPMVRRAASDPKAAGVVAVQNDAQYVTRVLNGLGFGTPSKKDDRDRIFTAIDRELSAAREGNNGRLTAQDRERIVNAAVKTYVREAAWYQRSRSENEEAIQARAQLPFVALRADQNLPVARDLARVLVPGREVTRADALGIEAVNLNDFPVAARREAITILRDAGIPAPSPYQIRALLYFSGAAGQTR